MNKPLGPLPTRPYSSSNHHPHNHRPPPTLPPYPHPPARPYTNQNSHSQTHYNQHSQPQYNQHPRPHPHLNQHPSPHQQPQRNAHPHPPPHSYPPRNSHPPPPPPPPTRRPPKKRSTSLASCIVATVFLLFIIILLFIVYFSLFKPKDPKITVTSIQLPTFSLASNSTPTASFTFSLYAAVRNPNRAAFSHYDSSLQLLYADNQVGFMFIPAGNVGAGHTEYMAATFSVQSFPISVAQPATAVGFPSTVLPPVTDGVNRVQPTMELEVKLDMVGRVRVLWFFSHHAETTVDCRVAVAVNDGTVLGFHC